MAIKTFHHTVLFFINTTPFQNWRGVKILWSKNIFDFDENFRRCGGHTVKIWGDYPTLKKHHKICAKISVLASWSHTQKIKKIVTTPFSQYPKMCHILDIRGIILAKNELFIVRPKILFYSKLITIHGFGNKVEFFHLYLHKQRF